MYTEYRCSPAALLQSEHFVFFGCVLPNTESAWCLVMGSQLHRHGQHHPAALPGRVENLPFKRKRLHMASGVLLAIVAHGRKQEL